MWVCLVLSIAIQCGIICVKKIARTVPTNYICLFVFTLIEAYIVAFTCAYYTPKSVAIAAFLTAGVTVALTIYALVSKTDFTMYGGAFYVVGSAFCMMCLIMIFLPQNSILSTILNIVGVILFGLYLIYDTQLIVGGGRYELS